MIAALLLALAFETLSASGPTGQNCGYERWAVKTGQDATAGQVKPPQASSLLALALLKSPLPKSNGPYPPQINQRLGPDEFRTVTVPATIVAYRSENDSDIHLILSDGHRKMIAEFPCPCCMANLAGKKGMAVSPWVKQVTAARSAFMAKTHYVPVPWVKGKPGPPFVNCNIPVVITGVVFFDCPHSQSGAAANAVEIHPILDIKFR